MNRSSIVKPQLVMLIASMTLINGIFNLIWGWGGTAALVLGTLGIGLLCAPFSLLPGILGVFEISYALRLFSDPPQPVQASQNIAILEMVCIIAGNVLSMVVGILALIFYNDPLVKDYFSKMNESADPEDGPTVVPNKVSP